MTLPTRRPPAVGASARVRYFGGTVHGATIVEVGAGGRRVTVQTEAGERLDFELNAATASFVLTDDAHGPRLEFD